MLYRANGKTVWITETGWATRDPSKVNGPSPGIENAANYWSQVACGLAARCIDFWWYILSDPADMPFFGVTDADTGHALYVLAMKLQSVQVAQHLALLLLAGSQVRHL
jgi:glucan endo-1,3-beta-D-glucosidase